MTAPWTFSVDSLPEGARREAWADVMHRLRMPMADIPPASVLHGRVTVATTPLGCEFAVITSGPQVYAGRSAAQPTALWLGVALEGQASLETGGEIRDVAPHAIIYGSTGVDSTLRFTSDFKLLIVKIPPVAAQRLIVPIGQRVGLMSGRVGIECIFHGLLVETARLLGDLSEDQFRPIEQAMMEFLVACLAEDGIAARGGASGARASHLKRICQKIETLLHDPDLTLAQVAAEHGVSARYVQKLFTQNGQTFSAYLKLRRLSRCHAELISPIYAQLSISEIGFRWGFNDAAHFSRSFRDQYGLSPREHRQAGGDTSATASAFQPPSDG
ncbi:helix-turn-helix domain-containing protein [Asticcacaulis sp. EMRT-3]|uniref:helix-turn-helix domain-containing protein n=1 Tax=Asticcacaulis sp. EMRT-3 TaxID=3040349 RepID=UPI0024AF90FC|nr:helix-turn-helix domain-containing protein [Asticcacaulis sp. EMRT-3]MDI7773894.1 helix-turn-helix domain-containing protein [Asticcacaulis sp. EMRT-3]